MNNEIIGDLKKAIIEGDEEASVKHSEKALESGISAYSVLHDGLMAGADIVGEKFETGEFFLPILMMTGQSLKKAMSIIEAKLEEEYRLGEAQKEDTGIVVLATVKSDIHDIGKNIVSLMLSAAGFEVHDLGVDVPIKDIIKKAQEEGADIIACSALLTTSLPFMRDLLSLLNVMGERERFMVMLGGASVTPEFIYEIGADGTADNAIEAVRLARKLIQKKRINAEQGGG